MPEPDALTIARKALERIAGQGTGRIRGARIVAEHDPSLPWLHWGAIAEEAIAALDSAPPVADPSGQPPATLTLRYCAECGRQGGMLGVVDDERGGHLHVSPAGHCPGTVQTLTYRLDAGQPDEPLTNSWNRPGWTGEIPAEAIDRIYRRLDGGAFGTTSKDAIKAVLHAAGIVLAEPASGQPEQYGEARPVTTDELRAHAARSLRGPRP